jgi:hypothetical protein
MIIRSLARIYAIVLGGGVIVYLHESSFRLKLNIYPEFQLPMCPGTGLKVCGGGGCENPI